MDRIKSRRTGTRIAALVAGLAAVPLLAGCFNGFNAQTSVQPPSGDGFNAEVGDVQVRSAVWVRSPDNPADFTLSATFVNTGSTPDALTSVTTETRGTVSITGNTIPLVKQADTRTGWNSTFFVNLSGALIPQSHYISTTFTFEKAGAVTGSVLVVPSEGIYAGITPQGMRSPSPTPTRSASPSGSASESHSGGSHSSSSPSASASSTESATATATAATP